MYKSARLHDFNVMTFWKSKSWAVKRSVLAGSSMVGRMIQQSTDSLLGSTVTLCNIARLHAWQYILVDSPADSPTARVNPNVNFEI